MGMAEQARKLMQPDTPKDEGGLYEAVEKWEDKVMIMKKHGTQFEMAAVFKVNALKSMMVGKN